MRIASVVVSVSSGAWATPVPSPSAEIRLSLALISECETSACLSVSTCSMKSCPSGQASPQSPILVLRGSGITIPVGALNLLINLCVSSSRGHVSQSARGPWCSRVDPSLSGRDAGPSRVPWCVWGRQVCSRRRCAERLCCPLRNVQGKELLLW